MSSVNCTRQKAVRYRESDVKCQERERGVVMMISDEMATEPSTTGCYHK